MPLGPYSVRVTEGSFETLTRRELQVLKLLAEGYSEKHTARLLGIGIRTVQVFRHNVTEKLGINGIAKLTRYVVQLWVVSNNG
jgi:DNA-binding NarL/FixJ family response regulator